MERFVPKRLRSWVRCLTPGPEAPCHVEERWLVRHTTVKGAFLNAILALKRASHPVIRDWSVRQCLDELFAAWNRVPWGVHPTLRTLVYKCLQERPTNAWRSIPNMESLLPLVKIKAHKVQSFDEIRQQFRSADKSWSFPRNDIPNWGISSIRKTAKPSVRVENPGQRDNPPTRTVGPRVVTLKWDSDSSESGSLDSDLDPGCFDSDSDYKSDRSDSDLWGQ